MAEHIITESELVLPSLWLMSQRPNGFVETSTLIIELTRIFQPTGIDAEILANRNDTYFSQKVRNLKSHKTFGRGGYAINVPNGFQITDQGRAFVSLKSEAIDYLFTSEYGFSEILIGSEELLNSEPERPVIPLTETVNEGKVRTTTQLVYERSQKLRKVAVEVFSHEGKLYCDCCNFEFSNFYGNEYGQSCIEIHHKKPLFMYKDDDMNRTIEQYLPNLMPVCPNCHRVIHKNHISAERLPQFKKAIQQIQGFS